MCDFSVPNDKPGVCAKCNGKGVYYGAGRVENGVFRGFSGPCYSCNGTGQQTVRDIKRNKAYNRYKLATVGV